MNCLNVQPNSEEFKENECVNKFFSNGCGCLKIHGKPCSNVISRDSAVMYREHCLELSKEETDLVIKGQLHSLRNVSSKRSQSGQDHLRTVIGQKYFFSRTADLPLDLLFFTYCSERAQRRISHSRI